MALLLTIIRSTNAKCPRVKSEQACSSAMRALAWYIPGPGFSSLYNREKNKPSNSHSWAYSHMSVNPVLRGQPGQRSETLFQIDNREEASKTAKSTQWDLVSIKGKTMLHLKPYRWLHSYLTLWLPAILLTPLVLNSFLGGNFNPGIGLKGFFS